MYHCFTNSPPGGSQTLPEAKEASFSMNPSYHHRKTAVGSIKLESGLHQPNGIRGTRADESRGSCRKNMDKSRLLWREQHQLDWVLDLCTDLLHLHLTKCALN